MLIDSLSPAISRCGATGQRKCDASVLTPADVGRLVMIVRSGAEGSEAVGDAEAAAAVSRQRDAISVNGNENAGNLS